MVLGSSEAVCNDIVFLVEGTSACGAYMNEIKMNYIVQTVEYFNGGPIVEDRDCGSETFATLYSLVVYHSADCLPASLVDVYGPFRNPHKFLQLLDKLDFSGGINSFVLFFKRNKEVLTNYFSVGHAEHMASLTEGMATTLQCFKDLSVLRDPGLISQKFCILICNSPPYNLPVMDLPNFKGLSLEQLAALVNENSIQLSIISPRRIPAWVYTLTCHSKIHFCIKYYFLAYL